MNILLKPIYKLSDWLIKKDMEKWAKSPQPFDTHTTLVDMLRAKMIREHYTLAINTRKDIGLVLEASQKIETENK